MSTDSALHMLKYWVEDKGVQTAFADYYPNLAETDSAIRDALKALRSAKADLMQRVNEITDAAEQAREGAA